MTIRWEQHDGGGQERGVRPPPRFARALEARGHTVTGGSELAHSREATVLRTDAEGNHTVTEGPYAETVEQLTGFYIVKV